MNKTLFIAAVVIAVLAVVWFATRDRSEGGGNFVVVQGQRDGHRLVGMVDTSLRNFDEKQKLPYFLSIETQLLNPTAEGLPTDSEAENLNAWEDAVEAHLRSQGKLAFLGRVSWNGKRQLMYYVDNQQRFVEALKALSAAGSTRRFAFACERDEQWSKADYWLTRQ